MEVVWIGVFSVEMTGTRSDLHFREAREGQRNVDVNCSFSFGIRYRGEEMSLPPLDKYVGIGKP